ncbi:MAG: SprT-like domain-containing protein [Pseudomonadota bacterium]
MAACCRYSARRTEGLLQAQEASSLARELLDEHGLHNWRFRLDHARQRCGSCHYEQREITLSQHFVRLNDEPEVRITLLHEIAHALVGPGHGHDHHWGAVAHRLGITTAATTATAQMPEPAWLLRCRHCGQTVAKRHRRSLDLDRHCCARCGPENGKLAWVSNP